MIDLTKDKNTRDLLDAAVRHWGIPSQMLVLSEESSELAAAATRILTEKGTKEDLVGEMADVYIMISQIVFSLREEALFDKIVEEKIERTRKRIAGIPDSP